MANQEFPNYSFPDSEIDQLRKYRDQQDDARLQVRFIAILMIAEKLSLETISSIIGKSKRTIVRWVNMYMERGINSLCSFQYQPKQAYFKKNKSDN
ncbi:helix-turn-helix domain-containing protein [bacterium]|nr:helix-turn-helix domain-containing protein [bacterium]